MSHARCYRSKSSISQRTVDSSAAVLLQASYGFAVLAAAAGFFELKSEMKILVMSIESVAAKIRSLADSMDITRQAREA